MKKLLTLSLAAFSMAGFVACDDDDDENSNNNIVQQTEVVTLSDGSMCTGSAYDFDLSDGDNANVRVFDYEVNADSATLKIVVHGFIGACDDRIDLSAKVKDNFIKIDADVTPGSADCMCNNDAYIVLGRVGKRTYTVDVLGKEVMIDARESRTGSFEIE